MNDYIISWAAVIIASLYAAAARLPDLDGPVLGACNHPFALAVECHAGDISRVALEG